MKSLRRTDFHTLNLCPSLPNLHIHPQMAAVSKILQLFSGIFFPYFSWFLLKHSECIRLQSLQKHLQQNCPSPMLTVNKLGYIFILPQMLIHIYEHMCIFMKLQTHILYVCIYLWVCILSILHFSLFLLEILETFHIASYRPTLFVRLHDIPLNEWTII